jgi:hypothetical protein
VGVGFGVQADGKEAFSHEQSAETIWVSVGIAAGSVRLLLFHAGSVKRVLEMIECDSASTNNPCLLTIVNSVTPPLLQINSVRRES